MIPQLATERLTLRGWTSDDFPAYAGFFGDPDMTRYIDGPQNRANTWENFCADAGQWLIRGFGVFAVEERTDGRLAGYAGLWHPDDLEEPELCWGLFDGCHGKGYATEAARAVQVWAKETLGLPPLMSYVHPDNMPSQKVAARLGASNQGMTEFRGRARLFFRHVLPGPQIT